MGVEGSKYQQHGCEILNINGMSTAERSKAIEELVADINSQTIEFGFRQIDPKLRGKVILDRVAQGMSFLPDYVIQIEGHCNLQKQEEKLTAEDRDRIQKLSEDRADACARLLKAAGVKNEITCIGRGALKGATTGGVRVAVFLQGASPQTEGSKPEPPKIQDEQPKIQDVLASINGQKIKFGFRKVDPDSRGAKILKSVADGMSFLPNYAIRLEGHSNLQKAEEKLTAEDNARIHKLCEDRADACARMLKAAGVQNDIACIAQGALKGETKGCVRVVVFPKATLAQDQEFSESEEPKIQAVETDLPSLLRPSKDGLCSTPHAACKSQDLPQRSALYITRKQSAGDKVPQERSPNVVEKIPFRPVMSDHADISIEFEPQYPSPVVPPSPIPQQNGFREARYVRKYRSLNFNVEPLETIISHAKQEYAAL